MIIAALFLMAQSVPDPPPGYVLEEPWKKYQQDPIVLPPARFGPGPHTLVIASPTGQNITRIDYKTGKACKHAREEVLRQVATPLSGDKVSSPVTVFCVPR